MRSEAASGMTKSLICHRATLRAMIAPAPAITAIVAQNAVSSGILQHIDDRHVLEAGFAVAIGDERGAVVVDRDLERADAQRFEASLLESGLDRLHAAQRLGGDRPEHGERHRLVVLAFEFDEE